MHYKQLGFTKLPLLLCLYYFYSQVTKYTYVSQFRSYGISFSLFALDINDAFYLGQLFHGLWGWWISFGSFYYLILLYILVYFLLITCSFYFFFLKICNINQKKQILGKANYSSCLIKPCESLVSSDMLCCVELRALQAETDRQWQVEKFSKGVEWHKAKV